MSIELDINVSGYKTLLEIEIGLREFIIDSFNKALGSINWIDDPQGPMSLFIKPDLIKKTYYEVILEARKYAVDTGWNIDQSKEIHGIYFLLFTDLKIIIESKKYKNNSGNKIDVFPLKDRQIKSIVSGMEAIFSIRNKLAHSILISKTELSALETYHDLLRNLIKDFNKFIINSIKRENRIKTIKTLIQNILKAIKENNDITEHYNDMQIKVSLFEIELENDYLSAFNFIEKYSQLKKTKGSSILIKNLIEDNKELFNIFIK